MADVRKSFLFSYHLAEGSWKLYKFTISFRACPVYESVLPDGECVKYLGKHRVAQSPSEIILRNDKLKRFYGESWEFVQLWFLSGKPNKSFLKVWLGT